MDRKKMLRFEIKEKIGEGSFSINQIVIIGKVFKAFDNITNQEVALKVEKEDKNKKILKFEYDILQDLQESSFVPRVYDFVENPQFNFIVMELLGKNISKLKKSLNFNFTDVLAYNILLQMLTCIENIHDKGYIHRDIKPSNFVVCLLQRKVYMVDFGLAKLHLNKKGEPFAERKKTDFRGTIAYASMNAHNRIVFQTLIKDLSRRDDLWSFFFVILEMLGETIPWRLVGDDKDKIEHTKNECLNNPDLFLINSKFKKQLFYIFNHLKSLRYIDRPDYDIIRKNLKELLTEELKILSKNDNAFLNYFSNSFLAQDKNFNQYFDILSKDTFRYSLSSNNNIVLENPLKTSTNLLNQIPFGKNNIHVENNKDLLKRKRIRNTDGLVNNSYISNEGINNILDMMKYFDLLQLDKSNYAFLHLLFYNDFNYLDFINIINKNKNVLKMIEYDLYVRRKLLLKLVNNINDLIRIQSINYPILENILDNDYNSYINVYNTIFDHYLNLQKQQNLSNNLGFPFVV